MESKILSLFSVSNEKSEFYKVTHVLDGKQNEISSEEAFPSFCAKKRNRPPEYDLPILMSVRRKEIEPVPMNNMIKAKKDMM